MTDTSIQRFLRARSRSKEPLLTFRWVVTSLPYGLDTAYVEEATIPFTKLDIKDPLFGAATYTYYPGFSSTDQFNLTFYEDSAGTVTKWILDWMKKIKNFEQGWYYLPSHYKEKIGVQLLDTRGGVVLEIDMLGVWPIVRDQWGLTYTDPSGHMKINQSFSADGQEVRIKGGSTGKGSTSYGGLVNAGSASSTDKRGGAYSIFENPKEAISGMFDIKLPKIPTPPVPPLTDKVIDTVKSAASERAATTKRALKDGVINFDYNDYDLMSSQGRAEAKAGLKESVKSEGTRQGYASAVSMAGSVGKVLADDVAKTFSSGASAETIANKEARNEGFLADVAETAVKATSDFTDTLLDAAENADADDLDFPTNMRDAVVNTIDQGSEGFQDDIIDPLQDKANDVFLDD